MFFCFEPWSTLGIFLASRRKIAGKSQDQVQGLWLVRFEPWSTLFNIFGQSQENRRKITAPGTRVMARPF